jgi:CheY-like chemotaxis protein
VILVNNFVYARPLRVEICIYASKAVREMAGEPRILCVDDREENLQIRAQLLQQFGCETLTATNASAAIRVAADEPIDLVLIDYHLANGETGEQVARDVRVLKPHLPLVMLTGDVYLPESACECVDAVVTKGVSSPRELFAIIQRLLPDAKLRPLRPMLIPEPPPKPN